MTETPVGQLDKIRSGGTPDRLYFSLALLCLAIAVVGFTPTYWAQLPAGTLTASPLLHLHAILFTAWPLLLCSQAWLGSRRRLKHHRAWGLVGISLASMMLLVGLAVAVDAMNMRLANGEGLAPRMFLVVPFSGVGMFFLLFAAAIANINRPDWHKRLMIAATTSVLQAAMARFFFYARHGLGPNMRPTSFPSTPVSAALRGSLLLDLAIAIGMIVDWRTRGRPHPAWLWSLGALLSVQILRDPLSRTAEWLAFTGWVGRFFG